MMPTHCADSADTSDSEVLHFCWRASDIRWCVHVQEAAFDAGLSPPVSSSAACQAERRSKDIRQKVGAQVALVLLLRVYWLPEFIGV